MDINMSEFTRSTKKMLSRASTTPRSLNAGMNQEFVDTRRRLNDISLAITRLSKSIVSARQTWTTVARQQRDFSHSLSTSFPQSGAVQQHAVEVEKKLRSLPRELVSNDTKSEAPHQQILSILDKYLDMLKSIQKEYKEIELLHTEKSRYQRKVDKLEKRNLNNRKNSDKLVRNVQKLNDSQKELDEKEELILERMRSAFQKHEAILQCAHHGFWMADNSHMETIEQATHEIRVESVAIHKLLLGIELFEDKALPAVPRPNLLEGKNQNQIENGPQPSTPTLTDEFENVGTSSIADYNSMSNQNTEISDDMDDKVVQLSSNVSESEEALKKKVETGIPDVPTAKPTMPTTAQNNASKNTVNQPIGVQ